MSHSAWRSLGGVRIVVCCLLFIHGSSRFLTNGVADFEQFFLAHHLPAFGAWLVTGMEILGTPLLAAGRWVQPLALYFAAELTMGVILVHAQHGWFVVGGGSNGMEYSVLLISVLLAVATAPPTRPRESALEGVTA
ncbi:MAG: DoxX family protein [Gemmatimonadetes bacterium]|nr:DoxX family protein [Gemmatimonadota bacterium]